jgi:hypothetical protein
VTWPPLDAPRRRAGARRRGDERIDVSAACRFLWLLGEQGRELALLVGCQNRHRAIEASGSRSSARVSRRAASWSDRA